MICDYGCGSDEMYQLKNGKKCCATSSNACPAVRAKNSAQCKARYVNGRDNKETYKNLSNDIKQRMAWNKGLTKETDIRVMKTGLTYSQNIKNGTISPNFKGMHHSKESRQKMSASARENNNGFVRTKCYEIFSEYDNKIVKVQGTYEKIFAERLNNLNIKWTRGKHINLKYKSSADDYIHTYFPDFYLPETNDYIEIKGHWWKSKDGRINDYLKMQNVIACNPDKVIKIYFGDEFKEVNIVEYPNLEEETDLNPVKCGFESHPDYKIKLS